MQCSNSLLAKRIQEKQKSEQSQKAAQWDQVQQKTPEIAKMMMDFNKTFGKPAAIRVEHRGEVILQSGEFPAERPGLSGTFRAVRGGRYAAS